MKKSIYSFLLFTCLIITNFSHARFDPVVFDKATDLYGNKTANLMELEKITADLNKQTPGRYAVPAFIGISHTEIRAHLEKVPHAEGQTVADFIDAQWTDFKKIQPQGSTTLATAAQPILKTIRDAIIAAFDPATYQFAIQDKSRTEPYNQFINTVKSNQKLLMVRSTGREDSKELANAGGNESVSSVPSEMKAITAAIGVVVESYYSEKSLGQRLLAKDKTIFEKNPFLPVMMQIMIGEQVGGAQELSDIPVSGVMFSQEAEGRTPGVAHIQATWGHNEGVVNGLVAVDSFYVGPSNLIHPIVRIKQNRLVTMRKNGKNVLERKANPRAAQRVQCLTPQEVIDLKKGADAIVAYYNQGPYDIEFVLLNGVINWVQARPITHKTISPSYLKDEFVSQLNETSKQNIYAIGAGGGETRIIASESAVIIADNIRSALSTFLNRKDKEKIKAIIVGEMAPATSHEATTFRAEGVPVLYSAEVSTVKTWLKEVSTRNILIDPQRELVTIFSPSEKFSVVNDTIIDGWFAHPISKKVSVLAEFYKNPPRIEIAQKRYKEVKTSDLINIIKNSTDATSVTNTLKSVLHRLAVAIEKQQKDKKTINPQLMRDAIEIFKYLRHSAFEVQQAFNTWNASTKTDQDRLKRLYPIVFFEALIRQIPASKEFVNDYSIGSMLKIELIEKRAVEELKLTETEWKEYLVQYAKAAYVALTDQLKGNWGSFVKGLNAFAEETLKLDPKSDQRKQNNQKLAAFTAMIHTIATLELMPLWLNVSFAQTYKEQGGDTQKTAQALLDEFNTSQALLKTLQEKARQLNEINMANWGEPDKFTKQWEQFQTDIINYFMSIEFIKTVDSAQNLGKNGAATVMLKFVDVFDRSIKALKASQPKYSNVSILIQRFKQMLEQYLAVLKAWTKVPSIVNDLRELLEPKTFKTVDDYISRIEGLLKYASTDTTTLDPSSYFNVAAAALGSKALWERSIGRRPTLEDVFTLIHQNLLVILGTISKKTGIQEISVPPLVEILKENIETDMNASLIGIILDNNRLTYFYNRPLENHSSTFQIIYDIKTRTALFAVQFIGVNIKQRWENIAVIGSIASEVMGLSLFKKPEVDNEKNIVEFAWNVLDKNQASLAEKLRIIFAESTSMASSFLTLLSKTLDKKEYDKVLQVIKQAIKNPKQAYKFFSTTVFDEFFEKGQSFNEAIEAAKEGMKDLERLVREQALMLFGKLVKKGHGFNEAIKAAKEGMKDHEKLVRKQALMLFGKLFEKRHGFNEAIEAAKEGIKGHEIQVIKQALMLFEKLVKKGHGFNEAIEAAKEGIKNHERLVREQALMLFEELVEKGHGFNEAIKAASLGIRDKEKDIKVIAFNLFGKLVEKGHGFNEAIEAAKEGRKDLEINIKYRSFMLFGKLIKKGHGFNEAKDAAKEGRKDTSDLIKYTANALRQELKKYKKTKE